MNHIPTHPQLDVAFVVAQQDDGTCVLRISSDLGDINVPFDDAFVREYIAAYKHYVHNRVREIRALVYIRGGLWFQFSDSLQAESMTFATRLRRDTALDLLQFTDPAMPQPISTTRKLYPIRTYGSFRRFQQRFQEPQQQIINTYHHPHMDSVTKLEQVKDAFGSLLKGVMSYYTQADLIFGEDNHRDVLKRMDSPEAFLKRIGQEHIAGWMLGTLEGMELRRRLERVALLASFDDPEPLLKALVLWEKEGWDGLEIALTYLDYH